jgi:surfeit locus 1 family protein
MRFRPLPVLTLFSLVALGVLGLLGHWQFERYREKTALAGDAPAVTTIGPVLEAFSPPRLLYGVRDGRPGWRVLTPVRWTQAGDSKIILVDSAYVAGAQPPAVEALAADPRLIAGAMLTGVRQSPAGAHWLTPPPDRAGGAFYAFDPAAMAAGLPRPPEALVVMPYADGQANPFADSADPLPPERHLGYALTWWGLAAALALVYLALHHRVGRLRFRRAEP